MKRLVVFALGLYAVIAFFVVIGGIQAADPNCGRATVCAPIPQPNPTPYFKGGDPFPLRAPTVVGLPVATPVPTLPPTDTEPITIQSCSQASYTVWENTNYNGDGLHVCYGVDFPDLSKVMHLQAGLCYAPVKLHDTWEDCLNSAREYQGSENHAVCFWTGRNYTGYEYILFSTGQISWPYGTTFSDSISSIRWC